MWVSDAWSFTSLGFLISVGWHADADNSTLGLGDFFCFLFFVFSLSGSLAVPVEEPLFCVH